MTAPPGPPPRSLLYVPADNPRFLAGAASRGADWVILDLEDGVAPAAKDTARAALATWVPRIAASGTPVAVRVNTSPDRRDADVRAALAAGAIAVLLPKADVPGLHAVAGLIAGSDRSTTGLIAIVEDAAALLDLAAIASCPCLWGLMVGSEDMALSLGADPLPEVLHLPKLLTHHAARARGLWSFGLLRSIADWSDGPGLAEAAVQARRMGFDGATCVHPSVVPILNAGFLPAPEDVAAARRILDAARGREGPFALDGRMVDRPVVARALRTLERVRSRGPDGGTPP